MKGYEEYKETTYDWLPSIPAHWDWLYLSQVSKEKCYKNFGNIEKNILSLSYGNVIRKKNVDFGLSPKDYVTYQIVEKGNIILRLTDLQNDKKSLRTGLVKERGIITSAYVCLLTHHNPQFLHYALHSYDSVKLFYGLGGGVRQSISFKDIRSVQLPLPPHEEQDQIVRNLDAKVGKINKLIRIKQKQIALLKEKKQAIINQAVTKGLDPNVPMKDSGIAWIGQIPEGWVCAKVKQFFIITKEIAGQEGFDVLSVTQRGIRVKDISVNEGQMAKNYSNYQFVHVNDYVMNHMDLLTGYVDCSIYFGVTSPDYRVFRLTNDIFNKQYFLRVFQDCYERKIFYGLGQGASAQGRWRLPADNFLNFVIPIPPVEEQTIIAEYVKGAVIAIHKTSELLAQEITLLTEYRTRLISDVVTGKVDVRGIAVPDADALLETDADVTLDDEHDDSNDEMITDE